MLVLLYIGDHAKDTFIVRLGTMLNKLVQKGILGDVTHVEAVHEEHDDGTTTIASASLRDGGVRSKRCKLEPSNWRVVDVPMWDVAESIEWFKEHDGQPYDIRGALATFLPGSPQHNYWFCNAAVGAPFLKCTSTFGPHHFAAIALSFGRDVTEDFFDA